MTTANTTLTCKQIHKLCKLLIGMFLVSAFLVMSASTSASPRKQIYQQLKQINNQQHLFFKLDKLNLSGLALLSLLTDLGLREQLTLSAIELDNVDDTDLDMTLALYYISSLSTGNQLATAANTFAKFESALHMNTLPQYIDDAMPKFDAVIRLKTAINKYKRLRHIPWPKLSVTFSPKLGQGHQEVKVLRHKLAVLGDIQSSNQSKYRLHIFDQTIINGLKQYQKRNGFKSTGSLNDATRNALNQSMQQRIATLQINLWRWLSLPRTPPTKYILVNIPAYDLTLIERGQPLMAMKVIVGKPTNQTPLMITRVSSVTLNPSWTPTRNIINNDLLPLHNKNNSALRRSNFYLAKGYGSNIKYIEVPSNLSEMLKQYRLVQRPGKLNALGSVRFNIKNNNAIYLHDTPTKYLFNQDSRALSHGCIRLEKPEELLTNLQFKSSSKLPVSINYNKLDGTTKHIKLANTLPVYITYQTAWVDVSGKVNWRDDLYNKDLEAVSLHNIKKITTKNSQ